MARLNYQKLAYDTRMSRQPTLTGEVGVHLPPPRIKKKPQSPLKGDARRSQEINNLQKITDRNVNQEKRLQCLLKLQAGAK